MILLVAWYEIGMFPIWIETSGQDSDFGWTVAAMILEASPR